MSIASLPTAPRVNRYPVVDAIVRAFASAPDAPMSALVGQAAPDATEPERRQASAEIVAIFGVRQSGPGFSASLYPPIVPATILDAPLEAARAAIADCDRRLAALASGPAPAPVTGETPAPSPPPQPQAPLAARLTLGGRQAPTPRVR